MDHEWKILFANFLSLVISLISSPPCFCKSMYKLMSRSFGMVSRSKNWTQIRYTFYLQKVPFFSLVVKGILPYKIFKILKNSGGTQWGPTSRQPDRACCSSYRSRAARSPCGISTPIASSFIRLGIRRSRNSWRVSLRTGTSATTNLGCFSSQKRDGRSSKVKSLSPRPGSGKQGEHPQLRGQLSLEKSGCLVKNEV